MNLDYIANINAYGENVVRLYGFGSSQADKFRQALIQVIIGDKKALGLANLCFIKARNCNLTLRISDEDTGIMTEDEVSFFCDLTIEGYEEMIRRLEPFCNKETKSHQWLYEVDTETDFLFSPAGTW